MATLQLQTTTPGDALEWWGLCFCPLLSARKELYIEPVYCARPLSGMFETDDCFSRVLERGRNFDTCH